MCEQYTSLIYLHFYVQEMTNLYEKGPHSQYFRLFELRLLHSVPGAMTQPRTDGTWVMVNPLLVDADTECHIIFTS